MIQHHGGVGVRSARLHDAQHGREKDGRPVLIVSPKVHQEFVPNYQLRDGFSDHRLYTSLTAKTPAWPCMWHGCGTNALVGPNNCCADWPAASRERGCAVAPEVGTSTSLDPPVSPMVVPTRWSPVKLQVRALNE